MHVPDVTDMNGGRMKAERFPWLTEDLISLLWVSGREGSREILKCRDVGGNNYDYSFDLYLSRFANTRVLHHRPAYITAHTHPHLGYRSAP